MFTFITCISIIAVSYHNSGIYGPAQSLAAVLFHSSYGLGAVGGVVFLLCHLSSIPSLHCHRLEYHVAVYHNTIYRLRLLFHVIGHYCQNSSLNIDFDILDSIHVSFPAFFLIN